MIINILIIFCFLLLVYNAVSNIISSDVSHNNIDTKYFKYRICEVKQNNKTHYELSRKLPLALFYSKIEESEDLKYLLTWKKRNQKPKTIKKKLSEVDITARLL